MLEVCAVLDRDVAIYLAGETVRITVTVRNTAPRGTRGEPEQLAWGSLQLICERTMGSSSSSSSSSGSGGSSARPTTSVTKSAATVYSSPPNILFCELQLAPGQTKQFHAEIQLSRNGMPPTFRGQLVKYSNRVTVAVSHVQQHIKSAHLPIRVIPSVGLEQKPSIPANPFLESHATRPSIVETVMSTVDDLTQARKSLAFSLTHGTPHSRVALLTLPKKAYKLGDDVCGFLDFATATTPCVQYSASIETEEILIDADVDDGNGKKRVVKVHAQTAPICAFSPDSTFRLTIPLTAAPTFSTDSVQLKWRLRFVFVVTAEPYHVHLDGDVSSSAAPVDVPVESFSWSTDLLVLPCKPQNAALLDNSFPNRISMSV